MEAYLNAAEARGARAMQINLRRRPPTPGVKTKQTSLTGNAAALDALKVADIVIDFVGLLWSAEQKQIQEAGTRILMSRESPEVIRRMFPTEQLCAIALRPGEKMLKAARELRITSAAGTDIRYKLGQYPVITQYGYHRSARPLGQPAGRLSLYRGMRWRHRRRRRARHRGPDLSLQTLPVQSDPADRSRKGMVTKIEGDHLDGELLREFMARFNDPRAYAVSHIGWGMDEKAQWEFMATSPLGGLTNGVDGRSFYGNVLFSTGPNAELGGTNDTGCHLDLPMRNCDLYLDNQLIVKQGQLVPAELRAAGR